MRNVPTTALLLGLAGLIPFVWGALTYLNPGLANWGASALGPRFVGPYIQLAYGAVILSFMSGVLWGFASKTSGARAAIGYILSVMTGGGPVSAGTNLIFGFAGLLLLDMAFASWGLAPRWWMPLRLLLTAVVIACLAVGVFL